MMILEGFKFIMYRKYPYFIHDIEHTYKKGIIFIRYIPFCNIQWMRSQIATSKKIIKKSYIVRPKELLGICNQTCNPVFNYGEFAIIKSQAGLNSNKISFKLEKG